MQRNSAADARSMLEALDSFIVGQRAAHKAESPARQLAAWLASIWDGARDDLEADAAIDAEPEHLVSFLDDGAFDVLGTGTVRSMAATAADEPKLIAPDAAASPSPAPASPAPPVVTRATPPGSERADPAPRLARISSSIATIVSGSFEALPVRDGDAGAPGAAALPHHRRRQLSPLTILLAIGAAAAAVFVTTRDRDRPGTAPPPSDRLAAGRPTAGPPNPGPSAAAQPSAGSSTPARSSAEPAPAGPPDPGPPSREHASRGPGSAEPRAIGQRATAHPSTRLPKIVPGPATPGAGHRPAGSGSAAITPRSDDDRPKPALCRVRINVTPWAYYTADQDPTQHETPGTIDLAPGPHRLHVWNPQLKVERDITINVPADRDTMNYSEPLQPSSSTAEPAPAQRP